MLISTPDRVIEVDLFDGDHCGWHFRGVFLLLRQGLLSRELLLPFAGIVLGIRKSDARDIVFRFGNKSEVVGAALGGYEQVRGETRRLWLEDNDRRGLISSAVHGRRDVPADRVPDVRFADDLFAGL